MFDKVSKTLQQFQFLLGDPSYCSLLCVSEFVTTRKKMFEYRRNIIWDVRLKHKKNKHFRFSVIVLVIDIAWVNIIEKHCHLHKFHLVTWVIQIKMKTDYGPIVRNEDPQGPSDDATKNACQGASLLAPTLTSLHTLPSSTFSGIQCNSNNLKECTQANEHFIYF